MVDGKWKSNNDASDIGTIKIGILVVICGVYFYTLEAKGIDGSNFISTKKMLIMK